MSGRVFIVVAAAAGGHPLTPFVVSEDGGSDEDDDDDGEEKLHKGRDQRTQNTKSIAQGAGVARIGRRNEGGCICLLSRR